MFRCPNTGANSRRGIEIAAATFEQLPDIRSRIKCPVCSLDQSVRVKRGSVTQLLPPRRSPGCLSITEVLRTIRSFREPKLSGEGRTLGRYTALSGLFSTDVWFSELSGVTNSSLVTPCLR